jgi:hypothetical protein
MKRKIGKLYNKTIIEGDMNLKTPNEIHKNELNKGEGENSTLDSDGWEYYKFDGEAVESTEGYDAAEFYGNVRGFLTTYFISTAYGTKDYVDERMLLAAMNWDEHPIKNHLGFRMYTNKNLYASSNFPFSSIMPLKELIYYMNDMSEGQIHPLLIAFANALTPCTKEEFEALITEN